MESQFVEYLRVAGQIVRTQVVNRVDQLNEPAVPKKFANGEALPESVASDAADGA